MMLRLDDRDLMILKVLAREGRISKADLARRINLSTSPAWERLKRLEAAGVIQGYHAEIALKAIAPHLVVFVTLELDRHTAGSFQHFETRVADAPEVVSCWGLGGGFDYLVQIVTRDIDSYQRFMEALLEGGGVARYYTYVVTKPVKEGAPPPLDALMKAVEPGG